MAEDFTPFASPTNIQWSGHVGVAQYGSDQNMVCMFYKRPVHNPAKSAETGAPFYEDKTYVRIHPPGERLNITDRPVNENDKRRFPVQWAQFQQNRDQMPEGTPVSLLYPDHPSIVMMLQASGVHVVQQLARLSGTAIDSIGMGAQRYVNDAQKYLEMANKGVGIAEMRRELDERDRQIKSLTTQLETLKGEFDKLRTTASTGVDLATLQALLSGAMQRPVFGSQPNKQFDVQAAQIAAVHPTAEVTRQRARPRQRIRG